MRVTCIVTCVLACLGSYCSVSGAQAASSGWQEEVRRYCDQKDWTAAMRLVDEAVSRSPKDMDVRAWRARVLAWSGRLTEAEQEYGQILKVAPNDPDDWMGLAEVYSREGRKPDALLALDHALRLDSKRADLHVARGRILQDLKQNAEARAEFHAALAIDPPNRDARDLLSTFRAETRQRLIFESNTDLFSFAGANQEEGATLISRWTDRWSTVVGGSFYRWPGIEAQKLNASISGRLAKWGTLTLGGAAGRDFGVIPQNEVFFSYDAGWRVANPFLQGMEMNYEQHWYWYRGARILALNQTTTAYFPHDWMWSMRITGARSQFPFTALEWTPSGFTKIGFPITRFENRKLEGNLFFATGTENYSQVDQIGHFSSHTYGGGLRLQVASTQDVSGFAGYQQRSGNRNEITFGLSYGVRF
jgi:tetratricopeptide (TPR) repeat protein